MLYRKPVYIIIVVQGGENLLLRPSLTLFASFVQAINCPKICRNGRISLLTSCNIARVPGCGFQCQFLQTKPYASQFLRKVHKVTLLVLLRSSRFDLNTWCLQWLWARYWVTSLSRGQYNWSMVRDTIYNCSYGRSRPPSVVYAAILAKKATLDNRRVNAKTPFSGVWWFICCLYVWPLILSVHWMHPSGRRATCYRLTLYWNQLIKEYLMCCGLVSQLNKYGYRGHFKFNPQSSWYSVNSDLCENWCIHGPN